MKYADENPKTAIASSANCFELEYINLRSLLSLGLFSKKIDDMNKVNNASNTDIATPA